MTLIHMSETANRVTDGYQSCAYCFGRLDPEDRQFERREFVQCTHCRSYYHAICWHQSTPCVKCGENDAITFKELFYLPPNSIPQPVQAATVKPSAVFYYLAGNAYAVPPFMLEHVVPAYGYWRPRLQAMLHVWHSKAKEIIQSSLLKVSQHLLVQEQVSQIGQFIQTHLAVLTQILVYLSYVVIFLLVRLLLRLIF